MSIFNLDINNMSLNNDTFIEACKSNNLEIIKVTARSTDSMTVLKL